MEAVVRWRSNHAEDGDEESSQSASASHTPREDAGMRAKLKRASSGEASTGMYVCICVCMCVCVCLFVAHKLSKMAHFVLKCNKEDYLSVAQKRQAR